MTQANLENRLDSAEDFIENIENIEKPGTRQTYFISALFNLYYGCAMLGGSLLSLKEGLEGDNSKFYEAGMIFVLGAITLPMLEYDRRRMIRTFNIKL